MHRATRLATLVCWLAAGLSVGPAPAAAATPAACDLHWQVTPQRDATPPRVLVTLTFDAGTRSRTELLLPEGSDVALIDTEGTPPLEAVPGRPLQRTVNHRPGERVSLRLAVMPGPTAWLRMGADSLIFAAPALLPLPTERGSQQMCLGISGLAATDPLLANQGQSGSAEGLLRLQGPATLARDWVVAAGALQQADRRVEGQPLHVVMAAGSQMAFNADGLADAAARQIGTLRRFWGDGDAPEQWLLLLPAPADAAPRGLVARQALLLQSPPAPPVPSAPNAPGSEIEAVLMQAAMQAWFRERFGPVAYEQRPDDPMTHWFSRGLAGFYSQRLRSSTAAGGLRAHAAALTAHLQADPPAPGLAPWVAMRWHTALREQGHAGLDAVLRRLMLPAAQSRATGPLSSPLAPHRLLAALRRLLADAPRRDLLELVERAGPVEPAPRTLGPCFRYDAALRQVLPATEGEASAACAGWLGGTVLAAGETTRKAGASGKPGKAGKAAPGSGAKSGTKSGAKAGKKAAKKPRPGPH